MFISDSHEELTFLLIYIFHVSYVSALCIANIEYIYGYGKVFALYILVREGEEMKSCIYTLHQGYDYHTILLKKNL